MIKSWIVKIIESWMVRIPYVDLAYNKYRQAQRLKNEVEYKEKFAAIHGSFWGVFETFDRAIQAAPETKPLGYDNADLASDYQGMLEESNWENSGNMIRGCDYPVLFWLKSILNEKTNRVIDFGGNIGIHYYSYAKFLKYPENLEWTICEMPEITRRGRELAESRSAKHLFFTTDFSDTNQKDIFIASGSVQYVEDLAEQLSMCEHKPRHLLINRLPLYDGEKFVTLQNGGKVFYPQYVFNKTEFFEKLRQIGYETIDIWEDRNDRCMIPFHEDRSVSVYSGFYAKLVN
jgi:putative methyltransferase (TIGR04325 family)